MQKRILMITLILTGCVPALVNPVAQKPVVNPVITSSANTNVQESIIPKPIETSTPVPTPIQKDNTTVASTNCESPVFPVSSSSPDPRIPSPRYDINYPINGSSSTIGNIQISVVFKDCARIRYYSTSNQLVSKTGIDISEINKLIKDYKIDIYGYDMSRVKEISFGRFDKEDDFEKFLEDQEKVNESVTGTDQPNALSMYEFKVSNVNVKDFVTKLRGFPIIMSANLTRDPSPV